MSPHRRGQTYWGRRCSPSHGSLEISRAHVPQAAMHRQAKALVDAVSGMIARHVLDGTRPQDAGAVKHSEVEQHLIEGHEIHCGTVSSPPWHAGAPEGRGVP